MLSILQRNIYDLASVVENCSKEVTSNCLQPDQVELFRDRCTSIAQIFSSLTNILRSPLINNPKPSGSGGFGDLRTLECILVIFELTPPLSNRELASVTMFGLNSLADNALQVGLFISLLKTCYAMETLMHIFKI